MRARRWGGLLAPALLLPLLLTGPATADPGGQVELEDLLDVPSTSSLRTLGLLDASARDPRPTPSAVLRAGYYDTCHDVPDASVDLRRVDLSEDTRTRVYTLTITACGALDPAALGPDGGITLPVAVPSGRDDGPDYLVVLSPTADGLQADVVATPSNEASTWSTTYSTVVTQLDAATVRAVLPTRALGSPTEIVFAAVARSGGGTQDVLPERYAAPLSFPEVCDLSPQAATVVVERGRVGEVLAAARGRGADVASASSSVVRLEDVSDQALAALQRAPGVRAASRPAVFRKLATANDPAFPQQWALDAIGAPSAWDVRVASGLLLAVVDDGVDGVRPELAGRVRPGYDTLWDVGLPIDSDLGGHGTAVTGLATAATDNGIGMAGVDWAAEVLPLRVFDAAGCADDAAVADAIILAARTGASVINVSLGGPTDAPAVAAAVREATALGSLVVAASGNARAVGNHVSYPAAYEEVVAVGATTRDGLLAAYSSTGPHLDVVAPGGDGAGTAATDLLVLGPRDTLSAEAGTSFASPLVAASALLFRAQNPSVGPAHVAAALRRTAVDAGVPGPDPEYGAGRLNTAALLRLPVAVARDTASACPPGAVPEDGLSDVDGLVHESNVDCIVWWGVAASATGRYEPALAVTRAQMASFLARVITRSGGALPASPPNAFIDDEGSVHEHAVNQLAAVGILAGRDGRALPAEPVTRAQMATFLVRAYEFRTGVPLPDGPDFFLDDAGSVHEQLIGKAAAAGFTGGLGSGDYGPSLLVRRDAMGSFLARVLDRLVDDGFTSPPAG